MVSVYLRVLQIPYMRSYDNHLLRAYGSTFCGACIREHKESYPEGYAAPSDVPCQCYMRRPLSKLERALPHAKINVTSKSPVGDISVVTLIRTDTTLDHSQKAEKV